LRRGLKNHRQACRGNCGGSKAGGRKCDRAATVSAGNDEEVGTMIAEAMQRVTKDGVITVEESKSLTTDLDVVGCSWTEAIFLPTSSPTTSGWWWNLKTLILLTDKKISTIQDLIPS